MMHRLARRALLHAVAAASLGTACPAPLAHATDRFWTGPSGGFWGTSSNWNGSLPLPGDNATVNVTPGAPYIVNLNSNYGPGASALANVFLTSTNAVPLTAYQTFGATNNLYASVLALGTTSGGNATFVQSASTNSVTNAMVLGDVPGSLGIYSLTGGAILDNIAHVGDEGAGTLTQTGGAASYTSSLRIGFAAGATGLYSLSGAVSTLSTPDLRVGYAGAGSLSLADGSLSATSWYVGYQGSGSVTQTGGSASRTGGGTALSASLFLGYDPDATGSYSLSGGTLTADANTYVGYSGTGRITQTGGTATLGTLFLGNSAGSTGYYSLSGAASLTTETIHVGFHGAGSFLQSDGTVSSRSVMIGSDPGSTGRYTLTGGSLSTAEKTAILVGLNAPALFQISGGSVTTTALFVGFNNPIAPGTVTQTGGSLTVARESVIGKGALSSYTLTDGSFVTSTLELGGWSGIVGNSGTFSMSGGTLTVNGAIRLYAGSGPASTFGLFAGSVNCQSLLTTGNPRDLVWTGGNLTVASGLIISTATFSGAQLTVPPSSTLALSTPGASFTNDGSLILLSSASVAAGPGTLVNNGLLSLAPGALVTAASIINSASATIQGAGSLDGPLSNAGTLFPLPASTLTLSQGLPTNPGTILLNGSTLDLTNHPLTNTGVISGHGTLANLPSLTNNGSIAITGGSLSLSGPLTGSGALYVDPTSSLYAPDGLSQSLATLRGPLSIAAPSSLTTITFPDPTQGSLDLQSTTLTTSTPPATIRQYLLSHQLFSSAADAAHTLGYLVSAGAQLRVSLTITGDANLDGQLSPDDYTPLDRSLSRSTTDAIWSDGDFNYDGIISNQDYLLIDTAYLSTHPPSPDFLSLRESQFGPTYVAELLSAIPEPSSPSSALYPLSFLLLLARSHKKTRTAAVLPA